MPTRAIGAALNELRGAFDMVAVFGGQADAANTKAVASRCARGLLLVSQYVTTNRQAVAARDQLRSSGASLLGCVLATPN
jgi:hypothetical protein